MSAPRKRWYMRDPRITADAFVAIIIAAALIIGIATNNFAVAIWCMVGIVVLAFAIASWLIALGYGPGGKRNTSPQDPASTKEPSRITMPSRFNTNHFVKVKLTEYGLAVYKEYLAEQDRLLRPKFADRTDKLLEGQRAQPDKDGYFKFQMYVLMHIFGGEAHMPDTATALPTPFETEIILLPSP